MSVKIRLSRAGAKKRPFYHIVIADANSPRDGKFIERVGTYNPMLPADHADRVTLVTERLTHWLANGAQPTDRVARFLGKAGLITDAGLSPSSRSSPRRRRRRRSAPLSARKPPLKAGSDAVDDRLILMGVIGKPHGVRGLVRVNAFTEDPDALADIPAGRPQRAGDSRWNGCTTTSPSSARSRRRASAGSPTATRPND